MQTSDVVVIGAGIVGASTAYYLARAGVDVMLVDRRHPNAGGTASQASAGGVRQQGRAAVELPLAIYSINLWGNLEDELEADLQYRRDGMTVVTDDEALIPVLEQRVEQERSLGLDIRMVRGAELHDLIAGLSPRILAGSYCPTDGHADPLSTINALVDAARRLGARTRWQCPVEKLVIEDGRVAAVETSDGSLGCRYVVLAAGYWSRSIAAAAGIDLPLVDRPLQMMVTARQPHALDQVLGWVNHGISLKQVPSGGFVIGGGWPGQGDPRTYQTRLLPGSMAKSADTVVTLYPSLAGIPIVRAWLGIEAFCEDEMQIVGPAASVDGLILAAGFSGHGFAIGPGIGSLIAQYLTTGQWPDMLKPFGIERFQAHRS
ncbi:MAG: FAD-binding oxidoreductase [Desulfobacterales bacterium]|nr:MAG: FAD-binding oxidoreductase [Desulfobacterales bacterium]